MRVKTRKARCLWVSVLLLVGAEARAEQPMKIGLVSTAKIYGEKAAVETVQEKATDKLHARNILVLPKQASDPKCRTSSCQAKQYADAGATHVLFVGATYQRNNSYAVSATLIDSEGHEVALKSAKCELICTKPDMYQKLGEIVEAAASEGLKAGFTSIRKSEPVEAPSEKTEVAQSKPATYDVAKPREVPHINVPPSTPEPDQSHARAWALIGVGAVMTGVGVFFWAQDGSLRGCRDVTGTSVCPLQRETTLGGGLTTVAGGLAVAAGILDLVGVFSAKGDAQRAAAKVLISPTSFAVAGRF